METQVLEGTLTEIQRRLSDLPYPPEARVRVTIEQAEPMLATKRTRNGITLVPVNKLEPETPAASRETAEPFRPTEFRNGVPLLPHREIAKPLTTEFVKQLTISPISCSPSSTWRFRLPTAFAHCIRSCRCSSR
jgi:hypothetical protein